jgi:GNAT superfamily N-acetyltransferase
VTISSEHHIRRLTLADVPDAVRLSTFAGWNQTSRDWELLLTASPEGCFGVEQDGAVVATATLVNYGKRLAWIGMVLTDPQYRRRGFAKELLTHILKLADALGIKTVKLDATEQGRPLYESYGFRFEQPVERWHHPAAGSGENLGHRRGAMSWREFDLAAFGADRSIILDMLESSGNQFAMPDGYLLTRGGRSAAYVGPCLARTPAVARELLTRALNSCGFEGWFWDLLPSNRNAVALANEMGFAPQRHLARMCRGEELHAKDELIYAIAGFELG